MNLVLVEPGEIAGERVHLTGRRAEHLRRVVGVEVGSRVRVGIVRGPIGAGIVAAVNGDSVTLEVDVATGDVSPPVVDLVLALPRPKVLSRTVQLATCFGVRRIDLVNAWRVDKSYFHSRRVARDRLREDAVLGCEQGSTTWVPDIDVHPLLMPFLNEQLSERLTGDVRGIVAHPRGGTPIEAAVRPDHPSHMIVCVGPEGGWIDRELASFESLGLRAVTIGSAVLRVEAAVAALLSQLELLRRLGDAP